MNSTHASTTSHVLRADLDALVFRARNRSYGAYPLRRAQQRRLLQAFVSTQVLVLALLGFASLSRNSATPLEVAKGPKKRVSHDKEVTYIVQPKDKPEAKPSPKRLASTKYTEPRPVPDQQARPTETITRVDSALLTNRAIGSVTQSGDSTGSIHGTPDGDTDVLTEEPTPAEPGPTEVFFGEEPAPLNLDAFNRKLRYPQACVEARVEGTVVLRVLVGIEGEVLRYVVVREAHPALSAAVIQQLPGLRFRPGRQAGHAVKVWVTMPFRFRLG
jgi:TonB family protein